MTNRLYKEDMDLAIAATKRWKNEWSTHIVGAGNERLQKLCYEDGDVPHCTLEEARDYG